MICNWFDDAALVFAIEMEVILGTVKSKSYSDWINDSSCFMVAFEYRL